MSQPEFALFVLLAHYCTSYHHKYCPLSSTNIRVPRPQPCLRAAGLSWRPADQPALAYHARHSRVLLTRRCVTAAEWLVDTVCTLCGRQDAFVV